MLLDPRLTTRSASSTNPAERWRRLRRRGAALGGVVALALVGSTALPADAALSTSERLQQSVKLNGLLSQTRALQQIADANDGNRAAGTTGYAASAGYVMGQLQAAGYDVTLQPFEFPFFTETGEAALERTAPTATTYQAGDDFAVFTYSGSGDVTAQVQPVDLVLPPAAQPGSTSGCEAADFAGFVAGRIALVQRGTCDFAVKAQNAEAAGAAAVIVFNEGQPGRQEVLSGTLGTPSVDIPVVGISFALGEEFAQATTTVRVSTATVSETRTTYNVIAETRRGRPDNVVMLGAHLDSVTEGPGINDNGSGSAGLLEIAKGMAKEVKKPRNKVRFAWWSAEEFGLLGSAAYVSSLSGAQAGDIALYLNFDMIASPNPARFVYDGDNSDDVGAGPGPRGSAAIEDVFTDYFAARDLGTQGTDFDGRSDYGPFTDVDIPAGGLFTGAEGVMSAEQAELFGGRAGEAFDSCYHQACDTTRNLDNTAFLQNARAAAHAAAVFAQSTTAVNGRPGAARVTEVPSAKALAITPDGVTAR